MTHLHVPPTPADALPTTQAWWQTGVVYQVYPRSFQDSDGDGVGDLRGVTARLDYLASLGIDAVWLSPVFTSPMLDFGYDVSDYCDVDPLFGDLDDLDELIREAHARNLRVLLDLVPNHTSDQHAWFVEARASRGSPKRDWYVWRDPSPDGGPPNNWLSFFGGRAWTLDETTGQYYLHQFLPEQPELNWANPEVRGAMLDVMRFWLDRGVDGFRVDVLWLLAKDAELRDEPPNPTYRPEQFEFYTLEHCYTQDLPEVHAHVREMRAVLDEYSTPGRERVLVGEVNLPPDRLVTYYGDGDEAHLPFNFELLYLPWTARAVREAVRRYDALCRAHDGWPTWVLSNHDNARVRTRVGDAQYRVAQTLLLTLRGTPTVYYGDELGLADVHVPRERQRDPQGLRQPDAPGASRDPARTPMPWDESPFAGFSTVEPWLPLGDSKARHVSAQMHDARSDLNYFRSLTRLRRDRRSLHAGDLEVVDAGHDDVLAFLRRSGDDCVLVLLNFTGETRPVRLPDVSACGRILLSSDGGREGGTFPLDALVLGPHEAALVDLDVTQSGRGR
ncbi:alpha-amylase family glycosyl hydrolase [Deinococcus pimensis]|uniref:alpha-amylase family glycosyl hydrolase n=1 Tax=Deinococcus pimensis TaxID=309888 RepID=UPI0005EB5758|nr:alpha-amylase family glycosyl hydrolase [Deinococcus pimensis]